MDKITGLASKITGHKVGQEGNKAGGSGGAANDKKDYLDKGLESAEQRIGGDKFDANKMQSTNDKITDTIKSQFKSKTGHDLPGTSSS